MPHISWDANYLIMVVSIIGTSITPWQQFYLQSGVVEKGLRKENLWASRIDVIFGSVMMGIVAFFIIVACGATLFPAGIGIDSAEQAALSLKPLAGPNAYILFAIGLANASLFSGCILPLATTYYICEAMGWEMGIGKSFKEAPHFKFIFTIDPCPRRFDRPHTASSAHQGHVVQPDHQLSASPCGHDIHDTTHQ